MADNVRVRAVGLDRVTARLNRIAQTLPDALGQELYRDMVGVMLKSQEIVPYLEGDLHDSGEVDRAEVSGGNARVALHYGSSTVDYALVQHEDMSLRHPRGGESKYLEKPLFQWTSDGPQAVSERALKRAGRR